MAFLPCAHHLAWRDLSWVFAAAERASVLENQRGRQASCPLGGWEATLTSGGCLMFTGTLSRPPGSVFWPLVFLEQPLCVASVQHASFLHCLPGFILTSSEGNLHSCHLLYPNHVFIQRLLISSFILKRLRKSFGFSFGMFWVGGLLTTLGED